MMLNVHRKSTAYQGREEGGKGVWRCGEREIIYLSLHCHHQNDFCIKMGSDESHFNVSVGSDGQSHKTVSINHNLFEEKGEPKRYRTEVLPLTSLTPNHQAKPAHFCECWRYHQEVVLLLLFVFPAVNGPLTSQLRHITMCNTKHAVKLCHFLIKFDRIVSSLIKTKKPMSYFLGSIFLSIRQNIL